MKDHDTEPGPFSAPAASERPGVPESRAPAPVPEDGVEGARGSEAREGGVNAKARGEESVGAGEHDEAVDAVLEVFLRGEHGRRGPPHVEPKFVAETRGEVAARYAGAAHAVPAGNDTLPSEAAVDVSFLRGEPTVRIERMAPQRARRRALIAVLLGSIGVAVAIALVPWGGSASNANTTNVAPVSTPSNVATEAPSASVDVPELPAAPPAHATAPVEGRDAPAPSAPPGRPSAGVHPPPTRTTSASASPLPSASMVPPVASSAPSPRSPDMIPSL